MCLNANNLYRWVMSQKLPLDGSNRKNMSKFNENYDEDSNIG